MYVPESDLVESINAACTSLGVSPLKVAKLSHDRKSSALKKTV